MIQQVQLYDDHLDFEVNKKDGPFGGYAPHDERYVNTGQPAYDFFGTPVYSPFGIAAGPLPTSRFIQAALTRGFDIVTLKSVRTSSFPLNPYPQVRPVVSIGDLDLSSDSVMTAEFYQEPLSIANSFGIPSVEPSDWQPDMRRSLRLPGYGQALLAAFQGTARGLGKDDFIQDHIKGVGLILEAGANVIEINLSCPNEGEKILACFDIDITTRIVTAVRVAYPDTKLLIKIAYFSDKTLLKKLVKNIGGLVDGISAINTIPMKVIDRAGREVFPGRAKAGISGAPIKWAGLEMTRYLVRYRDEFHYPYKIVGIGGVITAEDFHEYRTAGADIVMSVTGAMWNPHLAAEIKGSLV